MQAANVWQQFQSLPASAQRQVAELIALLSTRREAQPTRGTAPVSVRAEPFVGLWKDREDLEDSSTWVRRSREQEWG